MRTRRQRAHLTASDSRSGAWPRAIGRTVLATILVGAGISHLTFARKDFRAQVPRWFPVDEDATVLGSGVVEIALGSALLLARKRRGAVGKAVAVFFAAVFPGNLAQWADQRDAFGLDTDAKRGLRLLGQPVLVLWALWSTRDSVPGWRSR